MANIKRQALYYAPWPVLGEDEKFSNQWRRIRINHKETEAVVRGTLQDIDTTDVEYYNQPRSIAGINWGKPEFYNKFRWYYDSASGNYILQRNDGTVDSPTWIDLITATSSGVLVGMNPNITANLDMNGYNIDNVNLINDGPVRPSVTGTGQPITEDGGPFFPDIHKLLFNYDTGFYITSSFYGHPVINKSESLGRSKVFRGLSGVEWTVEHNFNVQSPLLVQVYDNNDHLIIPDRIDISDPDIARFYFIGNTSGKAIIATGGLGSKEFLAEIITTDGINRYNRTNKLNFNDSTFYLSSDLTGQPVVNFIPSTVVGETNTATSLGGDTNVFKQKAGVDLEFRGLTAGSNVTLVQNANDIEISSTASGGSSDSGFYGVIFKESESGGAVMRDDTLVVDSDYFYLSGRPDGKPLLSLHDSPGGSGEVNTATSLGGDTNVFKQKAGVDLEFRGLTQGSNITLTQNANDIEIAATDTGEVNTASNVGGEKEVFKQKTGVDFEFRTLKAGSNVTLVQNTNDIEISSVGSGEAGTGFYGVIFKESEIGGAVMRDDTLVVDSAAFYLSGRPDGKPLLSLGPLTDGTEGQLQISDGSGGFDNISDGSTNQVLVGGGVGGTPSFDAVPAAGGNGAVQYAFAGSMVGLSPGAAGTVLTSNGPATIPTYQTIDHGDLDGLSDDDHTQYILVDGTRAFTNELQGGLEVANTIKSNEGFYGPIVQPKQYLAGETVLNGNTKDLTMDWRDNSTFFLPVRRPLIMHTPNGLGSDSQTIHLITKNDGFYNILWSRKYIFPGGDQTPITKGANVIDKWTLSYVPGLDRIIVVKDANCFY